MGQITIVYWRDIPAQVIAKKGRESAKRHLGERFEQAIDRAAMRAQLRDTDAYLGEWRRSAPQECGDDLEAAATALSEKLVAEFDEDRLKKLVMAGGKLDAAGDAANDDAAKGDRE
ncbi:MAG: virulence factor [Dongiaceae bacterium]